MTETDQHHLEVVRLMYAGDAAERAQIAPDIVWHVPGHNPVSGAYRGYAEYTQVMAARMAPLDRWDFVLDDVMVNGDYVMTTWHLQGQRRGKSIDTRGGHLFRLNAAGQVVEGWGFTDHQDVLDDFFAD